MVAVALAMYGFLRVKLEGSSADATRNARELMRLERQLLVDWEQDAQAWVLNRPFWIAFWNWIYQWLYWGSVGTSLVFLWLRDRPRYLLLRDTLLIAAAIGLVIWATLPVAPPRFMGYVDTLSLNGDRWVEEQPGMVNRYAAVPSFHVGWPAIAGFVLARGSFRSRVWFFSMLPAVLLAFSVVFTGNHFVLDIVAGVVVVAVSLLIAEPLQLRRAQRAARTHSAPATRTESAE
jgi:small basic protein